MPKRYYWLKLKVDFFDSIEIKKLSRLAGGDKYIIIYLKSLLLAAKADGVLVWTGLEDSFAEELALNLGETTEDVEVTLRFLLKTGLAETQDNTTFFFPYAVENTGSEGSSAERMRKLREKAMSQCDALPSRSDTDVTKMCEYSDGEKEKRREEIRDREEVQKESKRVQGEREETNYPPNEDVEIIQLVNAFDYAFKNHMVPDVTKIRKELAARGYDPKGNKLDDR